MPVTGGPVFGLRLLNSKFTFPEKWTLCGCDCPGDRGGLLRRRHYRGSST